MSRACGWGLVLVAVPAALVGSGLAWQEWHFRQSLAAWVPVVTAAPLVPAQEAGKPAALQAFFGLQPSTAVAASHEKLELRAVFLGAGDRSRILLADREQQRFYKPGDRLPGGSVVRRIEADAVVLWRDGREERLALSGAAPVLALAGTRVGAGQTGPLPLKPVQVKP